MVRCRQSYSKNFQRATAQGGMGSYCFQRVTERELDTVPYDGLGRPVKLVRLICSFFRSSDDACTELFLVPSNFMAVSTLKKMADILTTVNGDASLASERTSLA